ncbi:CsgE family curli-type amyloid fiber assembly protein [Maribacter sp. ACAM166]|uniref:CsgE family curli-type amyloid fiber assembly protein n=1 Tax=Maribacter sp. ACAM166 TaxID=2508996 RepID=UPI0010FE4091|nr:CsgE family curli-type amyloid fiber assembly protein [Maribacter sp. ACAM166]TLP80466.1 hypothetical protein ES765_08355 [Maribacter sp. ACAM166]
MIKNTHRFLIAIALLPFICLAQLYNKEVQASINLKVQNNNTLQIVGSAHNKTKINQSLRYVLSVIKSDKNNTANKNKNDQEGRFVLSPSDKTNLSNITININEKDRTIILLLIYDEEDKILGKDRKVLKGLAVEMNTDLNKIQSSYTEDVKEDTSDTDGFVMRGMVIQDTKTKAGSDFYNMYYTMYLSKSIDGDEIVKITEELAIGMNTQIKVQVANEVVAQFILNPRNQYLKDMADFSIYRTIGYFERKIQNKGQIIRY